MLQPTPTTAATRTAHRMRLLAVCTLLTALVFQQDAGRMAPDTKLDLVVDPVAFLGRALHLWETQGFFGQVQNQAYGYLFPMGPLFAVGHLAHVPEWAVQRAWMSLLVCVAFLGLVRLAGALGIGTPGSRIVAGLVYALAPRMVTVLGAASVEALPMALSPWVLIPLVRGAVSGSPRRAAMRSGVAVLLTGGVNAVATAAVLPLAGLFLLTRAPGPRRSALLRWWVLAVALACAWWATALLLLGHYSPPFLDYIESARVTTLPTNLAETLRGTDHWLGFLADDDGPAWRAGWTLATTSMLVLETTMLAGVGLLGLTWRGLAHRTWLLLGVLTGLVLVTIGHTGPLDGMLADPLQTLLDGPLAALRNVHKFDPVLRLPLALGVAHLLGVVSGAARARVRPLTVVAVYGAVAALVAGTAAPLVIGEMVPRGSFTSVPGYWQDTATWLARQDGDGRALLVPSSRAGTYYWGDPRDEPLQALARSPWGVRDAVPLAPAGSIRMLDAVDHRLAAGHGSAGLTGFLARSGVRYLVVRNDLDYARADAARPVLVHAALSQSPGITRVATFGPPVGGGSTESQDVDQQLDRPYPAVEIFEVTSAAPVAQTFPIGQAMTVSGGPESLLELADRSWLHGRPTVATADLPPGLRLPQAVLTDGMRRRELTFGRIAGNASAVLARSEPRRLGGTARDYLPWSGSAHETVAQWRGGQGIASSSASDADAFGGPRPEHQPFAALDGDPATAWLSSGVGGAVGQWFELRLDRARELDSVVVDVDRAAPGARVTQLRVSTDRGGRTVAVPRRAGSITVPVPTGATHRVRVTATAVSGSGHGFTFGLRELTVPGVHVSRPLATPRDLTTAQAGSPLWVALDTDDLRRSGCVLVGDRPLCAPVLARPGEEESGIDRVVTLPAAASYNGSVTVTARPGAPLTALLDASASGIRATASSAAVVDPRGSGQSVVDRNLGTGWVAAASDDQPRLRLELPERRRVTGLQLLVDPALAASRASSVSVLTDDGLRSGRVGADGTVSFAPVVTRRLEVTFPLVTPRTSYDPYTKSTTYEPVGLSELRVLGADDLRRRQTVVDQSAPCGAGPVLQVDGRAVQTRVSATRDDLLAGRELTARPCASTPLDLTSGTHRLTASSTPTWSVVRVSLVPDGAVAPTAAQVRTRTQSWGAEHRTVTVARRDTAALLVVHENTNAGWRATAGGHVLRSVVVDGWQQGYLLPAGAATDVTLTYAPDRSYRLGLLAGLLAALLLVGLAVLPPRRASTTARVAEGALPTAARVGAVVVALLLIGGWAGLVVALGAIAISALAPRRRRPVGVLLLVVGVLAAGGLLALDPWPGQPTYAGDSWPAQLAVLVAVGAATVGWLGSGQPRTRYFWRNAGRSTRR
jgi:arabinofuranan 3-O-arabinosyltransferase